ncbi:hypothetical protein LUCX_188 [Xanthomonas phage vB_XciM_LucasX]|nr:hypothetical protein LUCX_188 [Xanthomonas phage vB_XciM_LucasX]
MAARLMTQLSVNAVSKFHATTIGDTIDVMHIEQLNRVEQDVPFKAIFNHAPAVGIMTARGLALVYADVRRGKVYGDLDASCSWDAMERIQQSLN